ncbi:MAG: hypothetical protein JAZ02_06285 [Candidatus Thiodiazotropha endolucinida]|nr:hypothetical protein [Candidatus Thiodiazotropha endolucinida]
MFAPNSHVRHKLPNLTDSTRYLLSIGVITQFDVSGHGCPLSPHAFPATATRASNSRAKGGAALSGACGPQWAGSNAPKDCTSRLVAGPVTGGCLARGVPEPKAPSSLASEAG